MSALRLPAPRRVDVTGDAAPLALAFGLALTWALLLPPTADLAAQTYRADLFSRVGFAWWDNLWYGGHYLASYSVISPALAGSVGVGLAGIVAAVLTAYACGRLLRACGMTAAAARPVLLWIATGTAAELLIGRTTFLLGAGVGVLALALAREGRVRTAWFAAAACAITSPVAAAFVALAAVAWSLHERTTRHLALAAAAAVPVLAVGVLAPDGGVQPFGSWSFSASLLATAAAVLLAPRGSSVRVGLLLNALAIVAAYAVPTPMGSNVVRLAVLFAGPAALAARRARGTATSPLAVALVATLVVWQWWGPVKELRKTWDNPSTAEAYYAPLLRELRTLPTSGGRMEVVPTSTRWEAVYVARRYPLARGWETQIDRIVAPLFFRDPLRAADYRRWLHLWAVRYVALPDVPAESWGRAEAALVRHRTPAFLRPVWRDRHWKLYRVIGSPAIVDPPARLVSLRTSDVALRFAHAGAVRLRVRWTPDWQVSAGIACVAPTRDGMSAVRAARPGFVRLSAGLGGSTCRRG